MSTQPTANEQERQPKSQHSTSFTLEPDDALRLANLCGHLDSHIRQIADHFKLTIYNRGAKFKLEGSAKASKRAAHLIQRLYKETHNGTEISPDLIHLFLQEDAAEAAYAKAKKEIGRAHV